MGKLSCTTDGCQEPCVVQLSLSTQRAEGIRIGNEGTGVCVCRGATRLLRRGRGIARVRACVRRQQAPGHLRLLSLIPF